MVSGLYLVLLTAYNGGGVYQLLVGIVASVLLVLLTGIINGQWIVVLLTGVINGQCVTDSPCSCHV